MRQTTLCYLIQKEHDRIVRVCLAMKKRGFGEGWWNGAGGKVHTDDGETIEAGAVRETKEELGVVVGALTPVARICFEFPGHADWDQMMHVFLSEAWKGEPLESEEMRPRWHRVSQLPVHAMWPTDPFWVPRVFEGKKIEARFALGNDFTILSHDVHIVSELS
ncbi:MAG: 8-oxo-dGTP diphosphatase [Patescibacteria group bacterium]